jgi:hypothetical protein
MYRFISSLLLCLVVSTLTFAQPELTPPGPPVNALPDELPAEQEGVETLTQGPIHEAFADPALPDPEPSPLVNQEPPAAVPEQPAAYKPDGDFQWIPGYWDWDDDADRFLWVTGVWRQPPPDMRWVPGYWDDVAGGWQRVKGFWIRDEVEDVVYYEKPPATLEAGPSSPAPAANYFWIPGSWSYVNVSSGFSWQAGYWAPYQPDWVWTPARWVWTPAGFVYIPGFWDHRMSARGQIFAPVHFQTAVYTQPGFFYRPSIVIPTNNLFIHLWVRPTHGCYYFGNFYGPRYANRGFISWSNISNHRHVHHYDPFYSYARVHYRQQGVDYLGRVQGWHNYYAKHPEHRPPSTFREQKSWMNSPAARAINADAQLVARPIAEVSRRGDSPLRVSRLDDRALETQAKQAKQLREFDAERRKQEREQTKVSMTARSGRDAADLPGRERPRTELPKTDLAVERGNPGDRSEKGNRSEKAGRPDKSDRADTGTRFEKGDRSEKGERVEKGDRSEKGEIAKGDQGEKRGAGDQPRLPNAGDATKGRSTGKLALPKVERTKTEPVVTRSPESTTRPTARDRATAPPLPTGERRPIPGSRSNAATNQPANPLPDAGKRPNTNRLPEAGATPRPTFGNKTGDQPNTPGRSEERRVEEPRSIPRTTGREAAKDAVPRIGQPSNPPTNQPVVPGRSRVELPKPGSSPANRGNDAPGRSGVEIPRRGTESPGRSNVEIPRTRTESPSPVTPSRSLETPRGNSPSRNSPPTTERSRSFTPPGSREQSNPASGGRERGGPSVEIPTARGSAPKAESRNPNPSQPSRNSNRGEGSESSESGKKKRDK